MDGVGDRTERAKFWSGFSAAGAGLAVLGAAAVTAGVLGIAENHAAPRFRSQRAEGTNVSGSVL